MASLATPPDNRQLEGYAKPTVDDTGPGNVARGVSQVGTPVASGPYTATEGKTVAVLEMILQELRTMNAQLMVAVRGGPNQDIDLLKTTY